MKLSYGQDMQSSYSLIQQHVNKYSLFLSNHHSLLYSYNIAMGICNSFSQVLAETKTCKLNSLQHCGTM